MHVSREESLETIIKLEGRDSIGSQWSVEWSTTNVPGMDTATGAHGMRRRGGRRGLRLGALALGGLLTMHCRVGASAISGGYFIFLLVLLPAVGLLANPLRHFEIYLGQWSLSGPGRAFRILPLLDGIGIAMCINAIFRSIIYVTIASICGIYLIHALSDERLPYTYCRAFNLSTYEPNVTSVNRMQLVKSDNVNNPKEVEVVTIGISDGGWRNRTIIRQNKPLNAETNKLKICKEMYTGRYPSIHRTPSFNYFYVEVMKLRPGMKYEGWNVQLLISIIICWGVIWLLLISEKIRNKRLIWNNMYPWFMYIPWLWSIVLFTSSVISFVIQQKSLLRVLRLETKEIIVALTDALEVAMYIHAASIGTELIHGKGLNHYASGHIDARLNDENVWHSVILLVQTVLISTGSSMCALLDFRSQSKRAFEAAVSSTLFVIPLYAKCTALGPYSHFRSSIVFCGLVFSYLACTFVFLKTALHTIFEYKVKLVFWEQTIVAALIITCASLSMVFVTQGGLPLLESMDAVITGVGMPFICMLEMVALMYVYGSTDFVSDMNIATEENACSSRLNTQWQTLPFIISAMLLLRIIALWGAEMPFIYMCATIVPILALVFSVPIRACHNAYIFLSPAPRHGT